MAGFTTHLILLIWAVCAFIVYIKSQQSTVGYVQLSNTRLIIAFFGFVLVFFQLKFLMLALIVFLCYSICCIIFWDCLLSVQKYMALKLLCRFLFEHLLILMQTLEHATFRRLMSMAYEAMTQDKSNIPGKEVQNRFLNYIGHKMQFWGLSSMVVVFQSAKGHRNICFSVTPLLLFKFEHTLIDPLSCWSSL